MFAANIIIGIREDDTWCFIPGLCQFFVLKQMDSPANSALYAMSAKLCSINPAAVDNCHGLVEPWDFEADAFIVHSSDLLYSTSHYSH
jgi:hypothetical protein